MSLAFVREAANAILIGPNGVGKPPSPGTSPIRRCSPAIRCSVPAPGTCSMSWPGPTVTTPYASAWPSTRDRVSSIDEIGDLSYSNRHADLLFEIVSRRYQEKSTWSPPTAPSPSGARSSRCRLCRSSSTAGASRRDPLHRGRVLIGSRRPRSMASSGAVNAPRARPPHRSPPTEPPCWRSPMYPPPTIPHDWSTEQALAVRDLSKPCSKVSATSTKSDSAPTTARMRRLRRSMTPNSD